MSSGQRADRSVRERLESQFDEDNGSECEDEDEEELRADSNDDDDDEDDEQDGGGRDRALNDLHDLNGVSRWGPTTPARRHRIQDVHWDIGCSSNQWPNTGQQEYDPIGNSCTKN